LFIDFSGWTAGEIAGEPEKFPAFGGIPLP
jgi:hypothetical protein